MNPDRIARAALDRNIVIDVSGLLAQFNDAGVLDPLDVGAARSIGRILDEPSDEVLLAAALTVRGTRFGHVCIRLGSIRTAVVVDGQDPATIDELPWPEPADWRRELETSPLVGPPGSDAPLIVEDDRLYLSRYHVYERRVASLLTSRFGIRPRDASPTAVTIIDRLVGPHDGDDKQRRAAILGLSSGLAVIAGGPGTGKTHTIGAMLAALAADGAEMSKVALCAPTGKAAARLGEAMTKIAADLGEPIVSDALTRVAPSTIHRLLGWSPQRGRFRHDSTHRLPHDVVVVDEMSMVSLPMAAKLLGAVRDGATVVLVGDPYQLESIEAGTVLADIVTPPAGIDAPSVVSDHVVVLDRARRFEEEGPIADFADAVRRGDHESALERLEQRHPDLRWVPDRDDPAFAELWDRVIAHRSRLVRLASTPGRSDEALTSLGDLAVLCARRNGPDGVSRWGREIESELDQTFTGLRYRGEWYPGRPVMITSNDYNLDLYNGDIGLAVETGDGLRALFDRSGPREVLPAQLAEISTVHAMTIHKSQGSQFGTVVVVLPDESSRLLTRELLYTAVTRARHQVWILGGRTAVEGAIGRSVERASGLGRRLWDPDRPDPDGM